MRANERGLTLVEVLVAMLIGVFVAYIAFSVLSVSSGARDQIRVAEQEMVTIQRAIALINDDLRSIRTRSIRDEFGEVQPALLAGVERNQLLELTRGGRYRPQNMVSSGLERVRYRLNDEQLVRDVWYQLDRVRAEPTHTVVVLEGVKRLEFRYILKNDRSLNDFDRWSYEQSARSPTGLPSAVEWLIETERTGEVRQFVTFQD